MSKPTREEIIKLGKQVLDNEKQRKLCGKQSSQELMRSIDLEARLDKALNEYFGVTSCIEFFLMADKTQNAEYKSIVDEIKGGAGE